MKATTDEARKLLEDIAAWVRSCGVDNDGSPLADPGVFRDECDKTLVAVLGHTCALPVPQGPRSPGAGHRGRARGAQALRLRLRAGARRSARVLPVQPPDRLLRRPMHPDDTSDLDFYGDPRRCPRHPSVRTSDPLGLHDAPCGQCEYEMEAEAEMEAEYRAARGTVHLAAPPVPRATTIDDDLPF